MTDRPLIVTVLACCLVLGSAMVLGALWSASPGGHAFAAAATSSYDSSWLPWAGALVAAGCAGGFLLGWPMARLLFVCWMGYGVVEGLFLLDQPHYSLPVIAIYLVIAGLLFAPPAVNDWFRRPSA